MEPDAVIGRGLTVDNFMIRRPPVGRAFLCTNDVIVFMHIHTQGTRPDHQSNTNDRSMAILQERGLITDGPHGTFKTTPKGHDLIIKIVDLPC